MKKVAEITVSYSSSPSNKTFIKSSLEAYQVALAHWDNDIIEFQEEVKLILLNRANRVLGVYDLSRGGVSGSIIDVKIVLSVALKCHASSLILLHNHPSGNLKPSTNDISITAKVGKACSYVDIILLDHLIVSKEGYYSFKDEGDLQ